MMKKITTQVVITRLSEYMELRRETADKFVKAFEKTILEGVKRDGSVTVDGIGTFKLVAVADRGSVDVNTGERIVIPGYNKLGFTPDERIVSMLNVADVSKSDQKSAPRKKSKKAAKSDETAPAEESVASSTNFESVVVSDEVTPAEEPAAVSTNFESAVESDETTPAEEPVAASTNSESAAESDEATPAEEPAAASSNSESATEFDEATPAEEPAAASTNSESAAEFDEATPAEEPAAESTNSESATKSDEATPAEELAATRKKSRRRKHNEEPKDNTKVSNKTRKRKNGTSGAALGKVDRRGSWSAAHSAFLKQAYEEKIRREEEQLLAEQINLEKEIERFNALTIQLNAAEESLRKAKEEYAEAKRKEALIDEQIKNLQARMEANGELDDDGPFMRFLLKIPWWGYVVVFAILFLLLVYVSLPLLGYGEEKSSRWDDIFPYEHNDKSTWKEPKFEIHMPKQHVLKKGETLTSISEKYYGTPDSMGAIWRLNKFPDPNNIPIGTSIKLP